MFQVHHLSVECRPLWFDLNIVELCDSKVNNHGLEHFRESQVCHFEGFQSDRFQHVLVIRLEQEPHGYTRGRPGSRVRSWRRRPGSKTYRRWNWRLQVIFHQPRGYGLLFRPLKMIDVNLSIVNSQRDMISLEILYPFKSPWGEMSCVITCVSIPV